MRYALAGRLALDNVCDLKKLLDLFLVERLFVSSQRFPRNAPRNNAASENNNKKGYHQASGKLSHRGPSEIASTVRPTEGRNNFSLCRAAPVIAPHLLEILLYTSLLRHYPLSVCSFLVIGPITKRMFSTWRMHEDFSSFAFCC